MLESVVRAFFNEPEAHRGAINDHNSDSYAAPSSLDRRVRNVDVDSKSINRR